MIVLNNYLRRNFKSRHVKKLKTACFKFIQRLHESRHMPMEDLSMMVQNFYIDMSELAQKLKSTSKNFDMYEFLELLEDFVCLQAHGVLFFTRTEEEILDISLQNRIRTLHWVADGFLETPLNLDCKTVDELISDAMIKISEMNSYKLIREKFDCLMKCATKISEAISASTGGPVSADDFFPTLIYIILKSNPTLMHSNLSFIRRFSVEFRTFTGETGYYFTTLCSAVSYIQDINANSLQMPDEVFNEFFNRSVAA
ncbi:Rab5 GDP/GTP exchange factor [Aphelenchoides bicaudatus]|nr:Rab5 GDP/GTP exchange factor [Aphelenchoides bicaudatus]